MNWEEKLQAANALGEATLLMRKPGNWYVDQNVEKGNGYFLSSGGGIKTSSPQEAVALHWEGKNIVDTPLAECQYGPTLGRTLPCTYAESYYKPIEADETGGTRVEFRLIYKGALPSEECEGSGKKGRATDKHLLRKHFHLQLRELWHKHPDLKAMTENLYVKTRTPPNLAQWPGPNVEQIIAFPTNLPRLPNAKTWIEHIAGDHIRCNGNRFVPLISVNGGFTCSLEILFLRRDDPGNIVDSGGDVDNRIKVLLDGLRMPKDVKELGGLPIEQDEDPFYCLLEDDKLITRISITTDRLVTPITPQEDKNDVFLVIHATMVNPSQVFAGGRLV